jgi:vesicle coat complex subunit
VKVTQLTGLSDPVYSEAYVNVNQYDIVLDVLIVNQTRDTLQNCTLELATLGDLKLVEKPQVGSTFEFKETLPKFFNYLLANMLLFSR